MAVKHGSRFEWYSGGPLLNAGPFEKSLQPCCKPGCTPFPSCCTCGAAPTTCGRSNAGVGAGAGAGGNSHDSVGGGLKYNYRVADVVVDEQ